MEIVWNLMFACVFDLTMTLQLQAAYVPTLTAPQPTVINLTECTFDTKCKWKMIAKNPGIDGNDSAWVLDTHANTTRWANSAHERFGPSALFQLRRHPNRKLGIRIYALETAEGKFLGYDRDTGNITVDREVSRAVDASPFLILTVKSTRYARFQNQPFHISLGKTSIICAITSNGSFLVASNNRAQTVRLGDATICSKSKGSKKLEEMTSELITSADYQFELLEAQLYARWLSKGAAKGCPQQRYCNSDKEQHIRHIWGQSYVCCPPASPTATATSCNDRQV